MAKNLASRSGPFFLALFLVFLFCSVEDGTLPSGSIKHGHNSPENYLWQSFEYPTDTLLPGMKIGPDRTRRNITSWKNKTNCSPVQNIFPPFLVNISSAIFPNGPSNRINFCGNPAIKAYRNYTFAAVQSKEETVGGEREPLNLYGRRKPSIINASELWKAPMDIICDNDAYCGPNALCNGGDSNEWIIRKWSGSCARRTDMKLHYAMAPMPMMYMRECSKQSLKNCSSNISGHVTSVTTPYSREMAGEQSKKKNIIIIGGTVAGAFASAFLSLLVYWALRKKTKRNIITVVEDGKIKGHRPTEENNELAHFDYSTMVLATDNFALCNKIGSGGIGDVYKGVLRDGQIVAVKKISFQYGERIDEFMTEVRLIAKFQHRNLVRLLGCCTEAGEKLLVYEYAHNRSLDFFIFGKEEMRQSLGWEKRPSVIMRVARGLLYLHQDSRLRVIHRDLKAANILLEEDMNPMISDFGTARIFRRDQVEDNTTKVVGTVGDMFPEYMLTGNFSEKSDVFSFGVLVLEIISGRRNKWISPKNLRMELLSNAWTLCTENQNLVLLDNTLSHPTQRDDIFRCAQVGLLCVQESPEKRPTMQEVVLMLADKNSTLAQPERPGFFQPTSLSAASFWFTYGKDSLSSECGITITALEGR